MEHDSSQERRNVSNKVQDRSDVTQSEGGAVLLSKDIESLIKMYGLVQPFDNPDCLRPASYDLRLGEEHRVGGKPVKLSDQKPYLIIPPYEVAIISTYEKLKMPNNLIGRWNLRIHYVYEGLIWSGGPQVDPGYEGRLYCPLYNLSTREVIIKYKDRVATIDFVKTIPFREGCISYERTRRDDISAYDRGQRSAPKEMIARLDRLESESHRLRSTMLTVISIIVASLAIISVLPSPRVSEFPLAIPALAIAVFASVLSLLTLWTRDKPTVNQDRKITLKSDKTYSE